MLIKLFRCIMLLLLIIILATGCKTDSLTVDGPSEVESSLEYESSESVLASSAKEDLEKIEKADEPDLKIKVDKVDKYLCFIGMRGWPGVQSFPVLYVGATRENMEDYYDSANYPNAFKDCKQALEFIDNLSVVDQQLREAALDSTKGEGYYINTDRQAGNHFLQLCGEKLTFREVYGQPEAYYMEENAPYNRRFEAYVDVPNTTFPAWKCTINTSDLSFTLDLESKVKEEDVLLRHINLYPWAMKIQHEQLQNLPGRPRNLTPQVIGDATKIITDGSYFLPIINESGHLPLHMESPVEIYGGNESTMVEYCQVDWENTIKMGVPGGAEHFSAIEQPYLYDTLLLFKDETAYYMKYIDPYYCNWFVMQKDNEGEYKLQEVWMQSMQHFWSDSFDIIINDAHVKEYDQQKALRAANRTVEDQLPS